jgi:hypothetical protein
MTSLISGIAMIAVFALIWGGVMILRKREDRKRGILMLAAAAVLFGNVLILTY